MNTFLRRNKRLILWFIILGIGIPFVFAGGFFALGPSPNTTAAGINVAVVGDLPISAQEFMNQLAMVRQQQGGQGRSYEELFADGTVETVLDGLIAQRLVTIEAQEQGLSFDREYLVEKLKEYPDFRDENGNFDAERWNTYVRLNDGANWNTLYAELTEDLRLQTYSRLMTASARVFEDDLREQFAAGRTRMKVRYVPVEPPVELTEEEIRAHYDADPSAYDKPERRVAQYASFSLLAERPVVLDEIMEKARGGADFAELAKEYSQAASKEQGGDMGWITNSPTLPDYQSVLFDLEVGEVSNPVKGPSSYFIYKVEEERTSDVSGERDVRARQIMIPAILDPEERANRREAAEALLAEARETGNVIGADEPMMISGEFDSTSTEIRGIPSADVAAFRQALSRLPNGEIADVISGRENLYVAKILTVIPPEPQAFEAVYEEVKEDAVNAHKMSPEYAERLSEFETNIVETASTLEEIVEQFPELDAEVETTREFLATEYLFSDGLLWNTQQVYQLVGQGEPGGEMVPMRDLTSKLYFIQLESKTPPDESVWENEWPTERERLEETALARLQNERLEDYVTDLRERSISKNIPIQRDLNRIVQLLGLDSAGEATGDVALPPIDDHAGHDHTHDHAVDEPAPVDSGDAPADSGEE